MATIAWRVLILNVVLIGAAGDDHRVALQRHWQEHGPNVCDDEQTSLLQTASLVQRRGLIVTANSAESNSSVAVAEKRTQDTKTKTNATVAGARVQPAAPNTKKDPGALIASDAAAGPVYAKGPVFERSPPPSPTTASFGRAVTVIAAVVLCTLMLLLYMTDIAVLPRQKPIMRNDREEARNSWFIFTISVSFLVVEVMSANQYLPCWGKMQADFDTNIAFNGIALTGMWCIKGVSALIIVGFADYLGRKSIYLVCSALLVVGSVACACAPSLGWFLAGRVFQGIGAGGEPVFLLIARDLADTGNERMVYIGTYFSIVFLMPVLAPALGGIIAVHSDWRWTFGTLAVWGLINTVLIGHSMRETRPIEMQDMNMQEYRADFLAALTDQHTLVMAAVQGVTMMLLYSSVTCFAFMLTNAFHDDEGDVSLKLALVASFLAIGGFALKVLSRPENVESILRAAMYCLVVPIVGSVFCSIFVSKTWLAVIVCMWVSFYVAIICCFTADVWYYRPFAGLSGVVHGMNTCSCMFFSAGGTILSGMAVKMSGAPVQALGVWLTIPLLALLAAYWALSTWDQSKTNGAAEGENAYEGSPARRGAANATPWDNAGCDTQCADGYKGPPRRQGAGTVADPRTPDCVPGCLDGYKSPRGRASKALDSPRGRARQP